ncbi:MAG TPA: class I SAM-dependent methyltransferase [Kofleriaceae bacterium]|nr:class I SAM-dependent methyltransferase [Kofleriaceae bacterium]
MTSIARFVGPIPELYDRHMGPVLFEPYAEDIAARLPKTAKRVLEIAAGTGRVTRHLLAALPPDGQLVATDLNEPMLVRAQTVISDPRVTWQTADMLALPYPDGSFDAVVCQFGLMFVPDKVQALREMKRVLVAGGTLLLSVWDSLAHNPASQQLHHLAYGLMADNPPTFMATPFSMHDTAALRVMADEAGFRAVNIETVATTGTAESAKHLATGFVRGNPLWLQLLERNLDGDAFEAQIAAALATEFGESPCKTPLSAHVLTATA